MAIQCLVGEDQNFVTDPMLHGKAMQFSQHQAIAWADADTDICRHKTSLGHNELKVTFTALENMPI